MKSSITLKIISVRRIHSMAEHEPSIGLSDDWYTPQSVLDAIGINYDLDPCSPGAGHWVPANNVYTIEDDGLAQAWNGRVFVNPPFGGRNGHLPWLQKFIDHNNGICVVRAYTSSAWFHDYMGKVDGWLFPRGKTKFIRPDGTVGGSPGHGIVIVAMGDECCTALSESGLGMYVPVSAVVAAA